MGKRNKQLEIASLEKLAKSQIIFKHVKKTTVNKKPKTKKR